jgi:hypothetical protein
MSRSQKLTALIRKGALAGVDRIRTIAEPIEQSPLSCRSVECVWGDLATRQPPNTAEMRTSAFWESMRPYAHPESLGHDGADARDRAGA